MATYEEEARRDLEKWKNKIVKRPSMIEGWSKQIQLKVNKLIPEKGHILITESIKKMVEATLFGSSYLTKDVTATHQTLEEKEKLIYSRLHQYKRTAAFEGAGTGAGGIFLGVADFPLLLSIKMKFIFDSAMIYGFDRDSYEERMFMLHVFQLAFSSEVKKRKVLNTVLNWNDQKQSIKQIDWRTFQQEYRDYLDIVKLLQLVPGLGAIVGAYVNYHMLDLLGEVVVNSYRARLFDTNT